MIEPLLSDTEFVRRLNAHPELRNRMESLLLAVEDETGELKTADAAEMRVIQEMRRTGKVALQSWAERQVEKTAQEIKQTASVWSEGKKKLCWHTTFGDISIDEPQYRDGSKTRKYGVRSCLLPRWSKRQDLTPFFCSLNRL